MNSKHNRSIDTKETFGVIVSIFIIALVSLYPYFHEGLYGYEPDYTYHMNRIVGVKNALLSGQYPVYVYSYFFDGLGYGSPMFYPDIFLIPAAVFCILGMPVLTAYKVYVVIVCLAASLATYFSLKYVCENVLISLGGTFLLMLSEFYLADIIFRAGLGSYISYIFLPVLVAGIYDFFEKDAKRTYLIGIGIGGFVLTHVINAFLGIIVTALLFVIMLFTKKGRDAFFEKNHLFRLVKTAGLTVLFTSYYTFPMFEQMNSGVERVYQIPWAHVSEFVQPFEAYFYPTGYFFNIAYVGIGIPVLVLLGVRLFAPKAENTFSDVFYFTGIFLLLSMSKLVPWNILEKTIFNQLQFTFRIYPYALCVLIFGICLVIKQLLNGKSQYPFLIYAVVSTIIFGVWQNQTALDEITGQFHEVTDESLAENSSSVGKGEWLPTGYNTDEPPVQVVKVAKDMSITMPYERLDKKVGGSFEVTGDGYDAYIAPQIYYKGYEADFFGNDGSKIRLKCDAAENGRLLITLPDELSNTEGTIKVRYGGTVIQKVSLIITLLTLVGCAAYAIYRKKK